MTSCCVNYIYTLPPKLSSLENSDQVWFLRFHIRNKHFGRKGWQIRKKNIFYHSQPVTGTHVTNAFVTTLLLVKLDVFRNGTEFVLSLDTDQWYLPVCITALPYDTCVILYVSICDSRNKSCEKIIFIRAVNVINV